MVLSDRDIARALEEGRIKITPAPDLSRQLGSVSVDFRLGTTFMVFEHSRHSFIDPRHPQSIGEAMRTIEVSEDEPFIMQPGDFALASTIESLELPDDLLGRLGFDFTAAVRTVRFSDTCEQQPQVIVYFGHGSDRGARIVRRGALFDRDRRRKAFDQIDIRLFHNA